MSFQNMRRNFWHNTAVHFYCAWVFLFADLAGMFGFEGLKQDLIKYGEEYHDTH